MDYKQVKAKLEYPFDPIDLLSNYKKYRRILSDGRSFIKKRIAILGGATTRQIIQMLDLFLRTIGIEGVFYESDYGKYYEAGVFDNPELEKLKPEIVYICTSIRNIHFLFDGTASEDDVNDRIQSEYKRYHHLWKTIEEKYHCMIIQNNFELPFYRLLGNQEPVIIKSQTYFINHLNEMFYEYAREEKNFFILDINYLAADFGLSQWHNLNDWYLYKVPYSIKAMPVLAYQLFHIIKSYLGMNKKAVVLDLDNTLWGGIISEDGIEHIQINNETPTGQAYHEFQTYLKELKQLGILLCIDSKNDYDIALKGIQFSENVLHKEDFSVIKANWERKDDNIIEIANELNILTDSLVFVDDNPFEREIVKNGLPEVAVVEINDIENYIKKMDYAGYFEMLGLSDEDVRRNIMYQENELRQQQKTLYTNYQEYLESLHMRAEIMPFMNEHIERITQLILKSNQFNLTTKRYQMSEIETIIRSSSYITLEGRLIDDFGDNGIVSLVIAECIDNTAHIRLWVMSCRVLKRNLEYAMFDELYMKCREKGINNIVGYYYSTNKNHMVKDFYQELGFIKINSKEDDTVWNMEINHSYNNKNKVIQINGKLK